jgi:succinate dehydrogenase/fumarate reductase flavoprotein subunit
MTEAFSHMSMDWPYHLAYGKENEIDVDVLVLGGGLAGCCAAISAAKKGLNVALVEQAAVVRSGAAGSGVDHWMYAATNPASYVSPEELTEALISSYGGYLCGINNYIASRESWDTLLELEALGMKIRDSEDEFKGAEFRDEATKLLFAYDYDNNYTIRIWGTRMKPVLYQECKRLGVNIFERTMTTSLLTEDGKQGARVIGATGFNTHTGEFYIFKGKATVLCMSRPARLWTFSTEFIGFSGSSFQPANCCGDGHAIAWRAGAEVSLMERSIPSGGGFGYPPYGVGNPRNTWYACSLVDSNGKEVPWADFHGKKLKTVEQRYRTAEGQRLFLIGGGPHTGGIGMDFMQPRPDFTLDTFTPPFYADLPSMPEHERRAIFGLMVGQEGKTSIPVYYNLTQAGFDPDQDMLQCYENSWSGVGPPQWRSPAGFYSGGLIINWDLMTSLEGLFAAGEQLASSVGCAHACSTGRYAGKKAADYAQRTTDPVIDRKQVDSEKTLIYEPLNRPDGIEWKELEAGIGRVMQDYCGAVKDEGRLLVGLKWLDEIKEKEAREVCARNPHELMRALEVLTLLSVGEMVFHASLARKASTALLGFKRSDYPDEEPPEERKWIITKLMDDRVDITERPTYFWGDLKENYEAHNPKS